MSISRKVFWVFLSVVMLIGALGATVYLYQLGNKRMHGVLHSLLEFNEHVHHLRELQLRISGDQSSVTDFDLQGSIAELKTSAAELSEALSGVTYMNLHLQTLYQDIDNYHTAIIQYSDIYSSGIKLRSEFRILLDKIHEYIHDDGNGLTSMYESLYTDCTEFLQTNSPVLLKKSSDTLKLLNEKITVPDFHGLTGRLLSITENIYLNRLSMTEKRSFLDLSSSTFIRIASQISSEIKTRDRLMDRILSYSATTISALSIIMAVVYWNIINRYLRRFLSNQSAVMEAIKKREVKKQIEPFSDDELGDLTQRMWLMASELYEKDEELRESEEKYRTYINTTPLAVLVFDSSRKIIDLNPGAENMFGYDKPELITMELDDLLADGDSDTKREIAELMTDNRRHGFLLQMFTKSRELIYATVSSIQIEDDRFVAFCQDITKRILLEQELKEINDNLKEQVKSEVDKNMKQDQIIQQQKKLVDMGMMVSAIAHQWRQPLNALALCVQDVKEEFREGEVTDAYLEMFEANTMKLIMHMSKTIDDFRDFFLPDKTETDFSIIDELNDLVRLLNVQVTSRNIDMKLSCTCGRKKIRCDQVKGNINCVNDKALVRGFPGEFKQVVINLIYNSVDAIEERMRKEPGLKGIISIDVDSGLKRMELCVTDNGTGIPEDAAPHIFDPYYTTKPEGKGTGIGLYMSKVIIENHMDGKLYTGEVKEGARMVIELPAVID